MSDRKKRILEGALAMAKDGATESERQSWLDKAQQLAEKYNLLSVIDNWDISAERKRHEVTLNISASSLFIHKEDQEWADIFAATLADAFALRVVKRKIVSTDDEYVSADEADDFLAYDFVGPSERTVLATDVCNSAVNIGYDLIDAAFIDNDAIATFMVEFAAQLVQRIENKTKSSSALVLAEEQTRQYISDKYNVRVSRSVVALSTAMNIRSQATDQIRVEAYLASQKMQVS